MIREKLNDCKNDGLEETVCKRFYKCLNSNTILTVNTIPTCVSRDARRKLRGKR